MFFQWVLCVGIWLVGLVVNMIQEQPPIFLPALIGGISWTTGEQLLQTENYLANEMDVISYR